MKRFKVRVGVRRKVLLLMSALPVMLIALGGTGMATEGITDGWLHSELGQEARTVAPARSAVTDGWLGSEVGDSARAVTAGEIAATEELARSTDGWLHSVIGDAARGQQPVTVVSSPAQTHMPQTMVIVSLISTALLAGMGGFFLRTRIAL